MSSSRNSNTQREKLNKIISDFLVYAWTFLKTWFVYLGLIPEVLSRLHFLSIVPDLVVPNWVSASSILLFTFLAGFKVWRREYERRESLEDSLTDFDVEVVEAYKISMQSYFDELEKEEEEVQKQINPDIYNPSNSLSKILGLDKSWQQHQKELKRYQGELEEFNKMLDSMYLIALEIKSSRHDRNVNIRINPLQEDSFYDMYEIKNEIPIIPDRPKSISQSIIGGSFINNGLIRGYALPTNSTQKPRYRDPQLEREQIDVTIYEMNADDPGLIYYPYFLIQTDRENTELEVKINSANSGGRITKIIPINYPEKDKELDELIDE